MAELCIAAESRLVIARWTSVVSFIGIESVIAIGVLSDRIGIRCALSEPILSEGTESIIFIGPTLIGCRVVALVESPVWMESPLVIPGETPCILETLGGIFILGIECAVLVADDDVCVRVP